jgi:hypothetical protein
VKVNSDNIDLKANISGQIFTGAISATNLSGTNTGDQTLAGLGGVPDTRTVNGKSLATDITLLLASTDFANQGTSTTVLHGNAGGAPTFSAVNLTSDVTGVLMPRWQIMEPYLYKWRDFIQTGQILKTLVVYQLN